MALYQAALAKSVSTGYEKSEVRSQKSEVIETSTVSLVDVIPQLEEIAKIQQRQEEIWQWLKVIGERLSIAIDEAVSATG